jgi:hypothetical protein
MGFDWVTPCTQCQLQNAFEQLKADVAEDVERAKSLPTSIGHTFQLKLDDNYFSVLREKNLQRRIRFFVLRQERGTIDVLDDKEQVLYSARPVLSEKGECCFEIAGIQRPTWYVRKLALEPIFFG